MPVEPELKRYHSARLVFFWVIILFVCVVSTANLYLVHQTEKNADRANAATCVLIKFLDGSIARSEQLIQQNPGSPNNDQRRAGILQAKILRRDLHNTGVKC